MFSSPGHHIEIILYYDGFNIANPLGNKVSKYKVSVFQHSVLLVEIYLTDFVSTLLCFVIPLLLWNMATKGSFLTLLLEDICKLETKCLAIKFENQNFISKGSISITIADNLAVDAFGGIFCNFCSIQKFGRDCHFTKDQLQHPETFSHFAVRTIDGCNENLLSVQHYTKLH